MADTSPGANVHTVPSTCIYVLLCIRRQAVVTAMCVHRMWPIYYLSSSPPETERGTWSLQNAFSQFKPSETLGLCGARVPATPILLPFPPFRMFPAFVLFPILIPSDCRRRSVVPLLPRTHGCFIPRTPSGLNISQERIDSETVVPPLVFLRARRGCYLCSFAAEQLLCLHSLCRPAREILQLAAVR